MMPERAKAVSDMTITQIIESQPDIAEMISWENLETFLTEKAEQDPVQRIRKEPTARKRPGWEAMLIYTTEPIPRGPPPLGDS